MINFSVSSNYNNTIHAVNCRMHVQRFIKPENLQLLKMSFKTFLDNKGIKLRASNGFVVDAMDFLQLKDKLSVSITSAIHTFELTLTLDGKYALRIIEVGSNKLVRNFTDLRTERFEWLTKMQDISPLLDMDLNASKSMKLERIADNMFDILFQLLQTSLIVSPQNNQKKIENS